MDQKALLIIIAAMFVAGLSLIAWAVSLKRRADLLQSRLGPQSERAVREVGASRLEQAPLERANRADNLQIRDLTPQERERFLTEWRLIQSVFSNTPPQAVTEATRIIHQLMLTRGYPVTDFDQRVADLSVHHPRVVDNYRAARHIALRHQSGQATAEDLRTALLYYRSLFDDLLGAELSAQPKKKFA